MAFGVEGRRNSMTIELPIFRLGLAGFSAEQQAELGVALQDMATGASVWQVSEVDGADAVWINGARVEWLGDDRLRVGSGTPAGRAVQLHLPDVGRPVAVTRPVACTEFKPLYSFDIASPASMEAVLARFDAWLAPLAAQFCLASHIVEHQTALGSGVFDASRDGTLLAVVNMQGETGVLPSAGPADFEEAVWRRRTEAAEIPEQFARASLAQLMWQYAVRTHRDVLPKHYRTGLLYFRRPPRLPQRMLSDSQLLLMRELAFEPATFETLGRRCELDELRLARDLAALYFVGTITSNPRRAAKPPRRAYEPEANPGPHSCLPSGLDSVPSHETPARDVAHDLTAPAPLGPR